MRIAELTSPCLCIFLLVVSADRGAAQQQAGAPLQSLVVSPDELMRHREEIGLTEAQIERIHVLLEKVEPEVRELDKRARDSMDRLAELLSKEELDEDAARKQLDDFLEIQKEQQRRHLWTMIQIRNELTAEQRQTATRILQAQNSAESLERRLREKLARIENAMRLRAQAGPPPAEVVSFMQKFPVLMQNGQTREAEQLLDRMIGTLGLDREGKPQPGQAPLPPGIAQTTLVPQNARNSSQVRPIDSTLTADGLDDANAQAEFYRIDEVQTIQLQISPENMQRMLAALPERIYVPASFQWRDVKVDNVAVRLKGNSSSNPHQRHKRSFLVKFNEYEADARFFGLRRVSFDNGVQFGSLFSEPIITRILRDQGLPTHRANYARIFLNGDYLGVYVNVERIDTSFVQQHLPDDNGALFKVDEGGPGSNLQLMNDAPSFYRKTFEPKSDSAKKAYAHLVEFMRRINAAEPDESAAALESSLELDDFLRVSAVMLFSGAFDQLTGGAPHNYYLCYDTRRDRWRYLPWDLDVGFCENAFGRLHVLADWNAAWPLPPTPSPNPLMERIVADPALLQRYRQVARTILKDYFEPTRLCEIIDANYKRIKPDLESDPFPHQRVTVPGDRDYDGIVESIKSFVRKRYTSAVQQLENPSSEADFKRQRQQLAVRQGSLPPHLADKIRQLEQRLDTMRNEGQDILPLQSRMRQIPRLLQQGQVDEAERLLDRLLEETSAKSGDALQSPPTGRRSSNSGLKEVPWFAFIE